MFLGPLFKSIYGIIVSFEASLSGDWFVLCEGDLSELKKDLASYDIECEGELRKTLR